MKTPKILLGYFAVFLLFRCTIPDFKRVDSSAFLKDPENISIKPLVGHFRVFDSVIYNHGAFVREKLFIRSKAEFLHQTTTDSTNIDFDKYDYLYFHDWVKLNLVSNYSVFINHHKKEITVSWNGYYSYSGNNSYEMEIEILIPKVPYDYQITW